ncbi:MAG: T9SS type A sorting domain-containing protein [Flavobacteriaceae bacterium]|nr:T9SS type A sorting domain-containing protein [Flavobacteriaceae bacterium]
MKKITLLLFVFAFFTTVAQNTTTGPIQLGGPDFTVQFDVNGSNNTVTMTMIGPTNRWLGVAINPSASGMGASGDDVIIFSESGLNDYYMTGGNAEPNPDTNQWNVEPEDVTSGVVTIVATRVLNTGESTDHVFTNSTGTIPLLWAWGSSLELSYHGFGTANRGGAQANFTLSSPDYVLKEFEVYPNPTVSELNFDFPSNVQSANVQVYNVLGKQIMQTQLNRTFPKMNTNAWTSGIYVVQIITEDAVQTKRIIKQ